MSDSLMETVLPFDTGEYNCIRVLRAIASST